MRCSLRSALLASTLFATACTGVADPSTSPQSEALVWSYQTWNAELRAESCPEGSAFAAADPLDIRVIQAQRGPEDDRNAQLDGLVLAGAWALESTNSEFGGLSGLDQLSPETLLAVTDDDKTNMLIGKLAKQLGAKRTHALVNAYELVAISQDLDIDAVLDPRALSVSNILTKLRRGRILSVQSLEDGAAEIAEVVTLDSSPLIGKPVDYANLPDGVTAAAIIREGEIIFPTPSTTVMTDDRLLLFYEASATRKVEQFFRVSADFF